MPSKHPPDTVLIVDDEDSVRLTFADWLTDGRLDCLVLSAPDAAAALALADKHLIDLAILDWHLGAGQDGLALLEDLTLFNPDVVAIMVTGFADRATPLMAMRMGVRDYLDKNQHLDREALISAVKRQLDRIRPAKREKQLYHGLAVFRDAVERVVPLVQNAAALQDPVPLPHAIRSLFTFLRRTTQASDGVLLVYPLQEYQTDTGARAYDMEGRSLEGPIIPLGRSLAGWVLGTQDAIIVRRTEELTADGSLDLQYFEMTRQQILAAPLLSDAPAQVVLELFDPLNGVRFSDADRHLLRAAAGLGGELLRQALAERQTQRLLLDALTAARLVGDEVAQTLRPDTHEINHTPGTSPKAEPLPSSLLHHQGSLSTSLQLAEAIRVLEMDYGSSAVEHCLRLVENLTRLLGEVTGKVEARG